MTKQKKQTKNERQQYLVEYLTETEKYQAVVDLIGKMMVDITLEEFDGERKTNLSQSAYCSPCLPFWLSCRYNESE